MIRPDVIKQLYPALSTRKYVKNPNTVTGDSIINKYLVPVNIPERQHPFSFIFKNALIEISRLSNYNIKTDFMTQLNLILMSSTLVDSETNPQKIKLVLFKSPIPGDINYNPNRTFNVIKRSDYYTEEQFIQWLDYDEICMAFYNGSTYFITRVFLQSVMNLKPSQTFEDYFNKIGIRYVKETTYNTGISLFQAIIGTMNDYRFDIPGGKVDSCIKILESGKSLPLLTTDYLDVKLVKNSGKYYLAVLEQYIGDNTSRYGATGLLEDLNINLSRSGGIQIDPVTANTLISYFYQDEDRFIEEGEDLLYHLLAYYPRPTEDDAMQRQVNNRSGY